MRNRTGGLSSADESVGMVLSIYRYFPEIHFRPDEAEEARHRLDAYHRWRNWNGNPVGTITQNVTVNDCERAVGGYSVGGSTYSDLADLLLHSRMPNYPFTQTTWCKVCTISTRSPCAAMTASMGL